MPGKFGCFAAAADNYPSRLIRLIVTFPAAPT
jgi:hypothetical protein